MKIVILHISDLHLRETDLLIDKITHVVDIVKNIEYQLNRAFVVVTGDVAFNGEENQLACGYDFLTRLIESLQEKLHCSGDDKQVPVNLIVVPGNHDCILPENDVIRKMLVEGILKDKRTAGEPAVIEACMKAQSSFFGFRNSFAGEGLIDT